MVSIKSSAGTPVEPIVDPDMPVIDAHFHLWNLAGHAYFAPDYIADVTSGHRVECSVYAECGMGHTNDPRPEFRPVGEMHHVLEQVRIAKDLQAGKGHELAAGILGTADLTLGRPVKPVLEAHVAAGSGRFRGIRARAAWDSDPIASYGDAPHYPQGHILREASFVEGARCLSDMNLVLDIWAFHTQLNDVARLARQCPELKIMIDHCGGPLGVGRYAGRRDEVFKDWAAGIRRASEVPNIHIKLSGLAISRLGFRFGDGGQAHSSDELVAHWRPYIRTCLDAFGPARCVFGSNFSVDRAAAPFATLLNAYKVMLADLPVTDRKAIFADNARRFYGLELGRDANTSVRARREII